MARFTPEQAEQFKRRLEELGAAIADRLRASRESARPVDLAQPIGRLARVDALQVQQMARAQRTRDEGQAQLVRAALARLQNGSYGECIKCEEEIEQERLEVAPGSNQCMRCRRESDRR
jgi:DnaK suppressor protein